MVCGGRYGGVMGYGAGFTCPLGFFGGNVQVQSGCFKDQVYI